MEEEYRRKTRNPREKKNKARITDEEKDIRKMAKSLKKMKKEFSEDEQDWNYWQEYYK